MINSIDDAGLDTDVVIIGAGMAGLSAAATLASNHIPFVIIEASHRIGGRAYSEQFTDGSWFDLGCSYLHEGDINPLTPIAHELGVSLGDGDRFATDNWTITTPTQTRDRHILNQFQKYDDDCHAMMKTLTPDCDQPISDMMDWDNPLAAIYAHTMAGLNASDVSSQSTIDYLKSGFGKDYPVADGLGNLVALWAKDIPVRLNCIAKKVTWAHGSVVVDTSHGQITGKRVLVTVSTSILASGMITFTPNLPDRISTAAESLPCGVLNKIGLSFAPGTFSNDMAGWHIVCSDIADSGHQGTLPEGGDDFIGSLDINLMPRGQLTSHQQGVVFAGGSFGEYLEKQGSRALEDYARASMVHLCGSNIVKSITGIITTAWGNDPWSLGSYSYALTGKSKMREEFIEAVDNTIYFAGEAASIKHYGTCHGAFISGRDTAKTMLT